MSDALPAAFESLAPFVKGWARADAAGRAAARDRADPEEARRFYGATKSLLEPALAHLDGKPLAGLDEADRNLMRLVLAFAHVAMAIEVQGPDEQAHARLRPHMRIIRAVGDRG